MSDRSSTRRHILIAAGVSVAFLAGCQDAQGPSDPSDTDLSPAGIEAAAAPHPLTSNRELAELRRATAPFHNFQRAVDSGYDAPITPCWYHGDLGAMGYHYARMDRLTDPTARLLEPEALMYEPGPAGQMRLVGMEYIVPIDAWEEANGAGAAPPSLLGEVFRTNEALGLYVLHVWLWRTNPEGLFADWNPKVSCEHAEESEDLGH